MRIIFKGKVKEMSEEEDGVLVAFEDIDSADCAIKYGLPDGAGYTFLLVDYGKLERQDILLAYNRLYVVEAEGGIVAKPPPPKRGRKPKAACGEKSFYGTVVKITPVAVPGSDAISSPESSFPVASPRGAGCDGSGFWDSRADSAVSD